MNASHTKIEDRQILSSLAGALVDHPRASLQELAQAIGISKTTLYRFCNTREQLIEHLMSHCAEFVSQAIETAELETAPVPQALGRLIANHVAHRELTAFLLYYWKDATQDPESEAAWNTALDHYFLRGQREGFFRIDIPAPALSELWVSIMIGLVDAERRGRVARIGLATLIEQAFLDGARTHR